LDLLNSIYGKRAVNSLVDLSNSKGVELENSEELNNSIENYDRKGDEGCQACKQFYFEQKKDFLKRKMDFPSWLDSLDFEKEHAKQIMMIGEDVSPDIDGDIGVAYGLGRYPIMHNGVMKKEPRNKLWVWINELFDNRLELVKKNVYLTDTSKCHAYKISRIWKKCSQRFLLQEIELINPKLIIFQGATAYKYTCMNVKFGGICLPNNEEINFLKIHHSSPQTIPRRRVHIDKYKKLIKDKILPLIDRGVS